MLLLSSLRRGWRQPGGLSMLEPGLSDLWITFKPGMLWRQRQAGCIWAWQVIGQTADLVDLQRILNRSQNKLSDSAQQNMTVRLPVRGSDPWSVNFYALFRSVSSVVRFLLEERAGLNATMGRL